MANAFSTSLVGLMTHRERRSYDHRLKAQVAAAQLRRQTFWSSDDAIASRGISAPERPTLHAAMF